MTPEHEHEWVDHGLVSPNFELRLWKCKGCTEVRPMKDGNILHHRWNMPSRPNYQRGCRCNDCCEMNNAYMREYRDNNPYYRQRDAQRTRDRRMTNGR